MAECPEGWVRDPKNKNKCIYDKKSSIKKGESEYKKHKSKQPKPIKPASKSELSKMEKDYQERVKKIPKIKKKSLWSRLFNG
tara:strand:- start:256 stop:501 length:246 start_codon:yes stop_codon:yes gene_type:complete